MTCVARFGPGSKFPNRICGAQVKGQTEFCGRHQNYLASNTETTTSISTTITTTTMPTIPLTTVPLTTNTATLTLNTTTTTIPTIPLTTNTATLALNTTTTTNTTMTLTLTTKQTPTPMTVTKGPVTPATNIFNKKFAAEDFPKRKTVWVDGSTGAWKVTYLGGGIETGNFYCNCPSWLYQTLQPKLRVCKHITGLITGKILYTCETPKNIATSKTGSSGGKTSVNKKTGFRTPCMLADVYKHNVDPTGWWASEKYDGIRGFWFNDNMYTRNGNKLVIPDSFRNLLPKGQPLDGELWVDRGKFTEASTTAQSGVTGDAWSQIKYQVFDIPDATSTIPVEQRIAKVQEIVAKINSPQILAVTHTKCIDRKHLRQMIDDVVKIGGEGLVLRQPGSVYEDKRTKTMLKYKLVDEMEGEVVELIQGIREGLTGSLKLKLPSGVEFALGGTLPILVSKNPPKVGDKITFNFRGMTHLGTPKFATFKCVRTDLY